MRRCPSPGIVTVSVPHPWSTGPAPAATRTSICLTVTCSGGWSPAGHASTGAILTAAVPDGVLPGLGERAWLCRLLGVGHVVVALTKADLVTDRSLLDVAGRDAQAMLDDLGYPGARVPVVPTSARRALRGDPEWTARIQQLLDAIDRHLPTPPAEHTLPLLMPIEAVIADVHRGARPVGRSNTAP
jgi:elongation factor Tu